MIPPDSPTRRPTNKKTGRPLSTNNARSETVATAWTFRFLRDHNLVSSMSRRGNCHANAVAESFFQLLKREGVRRQIYAKRSQARADIFNHIEIFYNPKQRRGTAGNTSPVEFERRNSQRLTGVQETRVDSTSRVESRRQSVSVESQRKLGHFWGGSH